MKKKPAAPNPVEDRMMRSKPARVCGTCKGTRSIVQSNCNGAVETVHCRRCKGSGWAFLFWLLASACCLPTPAFSATVTGLLSTASSNPYATNLLFTPVSTPLVSGNSLIGSAPSNVLASAAGVFSVALKAGDYRVNVGELKRDTFIISVPTNSATYNITDLITNALTYTFAAPPNVELTANRGQTNGYASLGANGQVPTNQLPAGLGGGVVRTNDSQFGATVDGTLTIREGARFTNVVLKGDVTVDNLITSSFLSTDRALITDGAGYLAESIVSSVELAHLDGVTANVQTNLDGKASTVWVSAASNALWTGNQSLNLNRMGLYHKQLTSGTGPTKVAVVGDSVDYFEHLSYAYIQKLGSNGFDIPYGSVFLTLHTGTARSSSDGVAYRTNWPGNYFELPQNAAYVTTNNAGTFGGSIYCNRIGFRTIDYGEGGTLTFWSKTNGGTPVLLGTVNTAGPHKHTLTQYPVLAGWYQVVVSNFTAGTVRFIGALQYDTNSSGFCGMGGCSVAGFSSDNISLYATNVSRAFFTSAAPCLTLYSEISDAANYTTNAAGIATWITNTFSGVGTFVMNGVWPIQAESTAILQSRAMRNNICMSNGIPYFDTAAKFGNYWSLTNSFGISDGTHITVTAHQVLADALWSATGTDSALAIGSARISSAPNGDSPFKSRDNVFTGYNQFGRLISTYGSDAGINYYDQVEYPGYQYAVMAVYYNAKRLWFQNQTLGGPVLVLNGNSVRNQSLVPFDAASLVATNSLTIEAAGTLNIKAGTNTRAGNSTLVAGTVTVNNTTVTANTVVLLNRKTAGGTIGTSMTYTVSAGTSFTITSNNVLDTSTVSYFLIENN